ncbi:MAG: hypothetical protein M1837_001392 [Sclerophora amabilis]|nr:MAG: hypothetical protein M1837_001392 [Sclerophora amabilis]
MDGNTTDSNYISSDAPLELRQLPPHRDFNNVPFRYQPPRQLYCFGDLREMYGESVNHIREWLLEHQQHEDPIPAQETFLTTVLNQALQFVAEEHGVDVNSDLHPDIIPASPETAAGWKPIKTKRLDGSKVYLKKKVINHQQWFSRTSKHLNRLGPGRSAAMYNEFKRGLMVDHSQNELEWAPSVCEAKRIVSYPVGHLQFDGYSHVRMEIYEMVHKLPAVKDRVFPVLVISAEVSPQAFIVVSVPVVEHDVDFLTANDLFRGKEKYITGTYRSIEYVYLGPEEKGSAVQEGSNDYVHWVMATTSCAKGSIKPWMSSMGVPCAIAKDVPNFLRWTRERRP